MYAMRQTHISRDNKPDVPHGSVSEQNTDSHIRQLRSSTGPVAKKSRKNHQHKHDTTCDNISIYLEFTCPGYSHSFKRWLRRWL